MAQSINKVILLGNLGADPEIRTTPNGATVANFRIACSESWKDNDGQRQERTEWVTCITWRGLAEIVQKYVRKGSKVSIIGKLQTRSWEDKNGGGKRYATEVVVEELVMCGGNSEGSHGGESGRGAGRGGNAGGQTGFEDFGPGPGVSPAPADDNLPF